MGIGALDDVGVGPGRGTGLLVEVEVEGPLGLVSTGAFAFTGKHSRMSCLCPKDHAQCRGDGNDGNKKQSCKDK